MELMNSLLVWYLKKRINQINQFKKYPVETQQKTLESLLRDAQNTVFGKLYDYKSITSWQTFNERVPINDYDSFKPYIERVRKGEQKVLWHSPINYFSKSSGTTNDKSKYIPVSEETLKKCHYNGGKDMLAFYCNNFPDTKIFTGKNLALGGSQQAQTEYSYNAYYGDLSAIIIDHLPIWAESRRSPDKKVALMSEWEEKLKCLVELTSKDNITSLAGVPSWILLLMQHILEYTGKKSIKEVWPNLEVFFHGGVNFDPYRSQYQEIINFEGMRYMNVYNASEGYFAIQDQKDSDDMLLMLDYGVFYEFIPMEEIEKENPKVISLQDVELNKNYALIISTNSGLWRYKIGDTVVFTSLTPHRIRISGRTKNFINACGEEIIIDNAQKALNIACEKNNAVICEYTAAPLFLEEEKTACHQWLVEFEKMPEDMQAFIQHFDEALQSVNSDYEAKRYKDFILKTPIFEVLPHDTFYKWLKSKNRLGGQFKVPRLSNDRKHVEEILSLLEQ